MCKKLSKLLLLALILIVSVLTAQQKNGLIEKKYVIDENGDELVMKRIAGYPPEVLPETNKNLPSKDAKLPGEIFWLDNTPAYDWCYGCTATATAIAVAYYDNTGVVNAYTGGVTAVNGGVAPMSNVIWDGQSSQTGTSQCAIAGTKQSVDGRDKYGHGDDYWVDYLNETDPYYGSWTEHTYSEAGYNHCTADYMGTNQWNNWGNVDGSTTIWNYTRGQRMYDKADDLSSTPPSRDGCHGLRLLYEAMGYTVDVNYNQLYLGYNDPADSPDEGPTTQGFTFEDYMDQIDRGYPVIIQIEGHSMTGYGYDNTGTNQTCYVMDTWDRNNTPGAHTMEWGGSYSGMAHNGVSVVEIGTESGWFAPRNIFALNDNRTVTVTWDDPSKGTVANIEYQIFRDGVSIATGLTTESYIDTYQGDGSQDGMHYYRLKSIYPSVPYTTIISGEESAVFVSESVTEFHDTFESGSGQWLLSNGWGLCTEWKYAGAYSLSESPNADYTNDTDELPEGGSVGEIAPGLNFSAAADVSMDFWFKYDIELGFDYMHLQVCKDGINWVSIKVWDGEGVAWYQENISLGLFAGEANVRLRFLWVSDPGYVAEGSNIDNLNIVPSSVDSSPPYVYYTKDKDYYDSNPNGFEITTDITDFSGVNYANVLYSVNGGVDSTLVPTSVTGDEYYYVIPKQTPGAYVEFRFDCRDNYSPANQGYTGPFFYQAGLHQKYDNSVVDFIQPIYYSPTGDPSYKEAQIICTYFSSYHDDLVGVVIRGYDDADQPEDNSDFVIHVYADDNGGLPGGTELITPFSVPNPATLSETNKWTYIDLSGLGLNDMTNYFIGIGCDNNVTGDITRSTLTDCGLPGNYDYGRSYSKSIPAGGSAPAVWMKDDGYNYHMRAVTTNYEVTPPMIDTTPNNLTETIATDGISSELLNVANIGGYQLDYTAIFEYTSGPGGGAPTITVESNDFESGLVYTNAGSWATAAGLTVTCARVASTTGGSPVGTVTSTLTSAAFDGTGCSSLYLDFDQAAAISSANTSVKAEYYNGTAWVQIYASGASTTAHQRIALPDIATNMQLRFTAKLQKLAGDSWRIDNVVVSGPEVFTYTWLTLDGLLTTSASVAPAASDDMTIGYNATGLTTEGDYDAVIHLTAPDAAPVDVIVRMTVLNGPPPPTNVVGVISGTDFVITWDAAVGATSYIVYSSDDPYGTFVLDGTGAFVDLQWAVPASLAKMFYYIKSSDAKTSAPKTIVIKKSAVR